MPVASFLEQKLGKFPHLFIYALLEWTVILLLFVDGLLSFVSNQFAKFFQLRIPCLLCTRIDHLLVKTSSTFYFNDSICPSHKRDISSLAYCHIHNKLSDSRTVCQPCLRSLRRDDMQLSSHHNTACSCCGDIINFTSSSKYVKTLPTNVPASSPRLSCLANAPASSPRASCLANGPTVESPRSRFADVKFLENDADNQDASRTPIFVRRNKSFGMPLNSASCLANGPTVESPRSRFGDVKFLENDADNQDASRTPIFVRRNKSFGMSLTSAPVSPRIWLNNGGSRKISVERGDSAMEPNESSLINEVDVEILNRLKTQIRLDHKSLTELYMELDEERSASNVAANNAMAMITRLQAEKAAVQMEALQYQRMMEEQAEYDEDAIQVLRDELLKRDDDVRALESELEMYREKYGLIKKIGSDICEVDADEDYYEERKSDCGSLNGDHEHQQNGSEGNKEESCFDFEGERSYLLGMLADLEKKVIADDEEESIKHEDEDRGEQNKATLTRQLSLIKERLRAIEADSGFLKHAAITLQRGDEGNKVLTEIAQHLRMLRHSTKSSSDHLHV